MINSNLIKFVILILYPFVFNATYSQLTTNLFGSVIDEVGEPLAGASVFLEGTDKGAETDFDGNYQIQNVKPGSYNLVISYLGYETRTSFNIIVRTKGTPNYYFDLKTPTPDFTFFNGL